MPSEFPLFACFCIPYVMQEAQGLSSLRPQLDALSVPLYAVVHENLGVAEFQPFFDGEIFLDQERGFYGPVERTMFLSGILRTSVMKKIYNAKPEGNLKGEGRILGGVFVVGAGHQGILLEHREKEFGDYADTTEVLAAAKKVQPKSKI
ncbi:redox-regulatory protein fam213a [Plakobranchus ocellatus]|uniref:Peroxiredoxin-like 2A n=1 Tax=Plakobranchus ocellatus TaxID=259542 RepID=A0AAV4CMP1_9GAST|nr:redox-regulatory protein fam213a [Plakobranchus ocellatus]